MYTCKAYKNCPNYELWCLLKFRILVRNQPKTKCRIISDLIQNLCNKIQQVLHYIALNYWCWLLSSVGVTTITCCSFFTPQKTKQEMKVCIVHSVLILDLYQYLQILKAETSISCQKWKYSMEAAQLKTLSWLKLLHTGPWSRYFSLLRVYWMLWINQWWTVTIKSLISTFQQLVFNVTVVSVSRMESLQTPP